MRIGSRNKAKAQKKQQAKRKGSGAKENAGSRAMSGGAILSALQNDSTALAALTQEIGGNLLTSGFAIEIISAISAAINSGQAGGAGRLLAGAISSAAGALLLNGSSQAYEAMVYLNGSATAVACYVPTHLRATIASGQSVWVQPINGNMSDLVIVLLRNIF